MRSSKYPEAAFLAAMTAGATHEVRNVLAIIKESAGLIQDLLQVSRHRSDMDEEKVQRAVDRIETQVKRGADLLTNLNRLAHTLDQDRSTVDLGQEVEQLVFLSQRFARKKGHQVSAVTETEECPLNTDALLLHMVLFAAMECCLEELPEGSLLTVEVNRLGEDPGVVYRGTRADGHPPECTEESACWETVRQLAAGLGASAQRSEDGYGIRILFREWTQRA